jgi:ABC-type multidrug transport system fused ATPase/permease subunit
MAAPLPAIRTFSAFILLLALAVFPGLLIAGLLLIAAASRPVGIIPPTVPLALMAGALIAGMFWIMQFIGARKTARSLGYELGPLQVPRASQAVEIEVHAGVEQTRAAVLASLGDLNWRLTVTDSGDTLSTTTRASWFSWGDRVQVLVRPIDSQRTLLVVSSRPVLFTNFIELGKNLENVGLVVRRVQKAIAAPPAIG